MPSDRAYAWAVLLALPVLACVTFSSPGVPRYLSRLQDVTSYSVSVPSTTPGGVRYGGALDPAHIDRAVNAVAVCLERFQEPTQEQRVAMECLPGVIRRDVDRKAFDVYLADDWRPACRDPKEQTFPCQIGPQGCLAKGLDPTPECPCMCRSVVQSNRTIITTPNLKLFPAELVRLVTGCNVVWAGPLAECAQPVR